jgi:Flp pilus assembly protein TadG
MRECLKHEGMMRDDRAVALTECAIVMPVVMLFFLAILQYFEFVRDAQMVNYAAYVSARSYCTLHQQSYASDSAVMALAPVCKNLGAGLSSLGGIGSGVSSFFSKIPAGQTATEFASGAAGAYASLQGNFTVTTNAVKGGTGLEQVNTTIHYPDLINIFGLGGMWNYMGGVGNGGLNLLNSMSLQMEPLSSGLSTADRAIGLVGNGVVDITSISSIEYESWGDPTAYQKALKNNNDYNTAYQGWWPGSSGSWQPRSAAQP